MSIRGIISNARRAITANPRRWAIGLTTVVAVAGVGWYVAQSYFRPPPTPPAPPDGLDPAAAAAIATARQRVLERPRDAAAWGGLAAVYWGQLLTVESAACATEAHRLDPDDARWSYLLGYLSLYYNPHDAIPHLRAAAAGRCPSPTHKAAAELRLAEALLDRQDLAGAEAEFRRRLAAVPNDPRARLGLGRTLMAREDAAGAAAEFRAAAGSPFARRQALSQLAQAARMSGDDAAAAGYERQVDPLPPDDPWPDPFLVEWSAHRTKDELPRNRAAALAKNGKHQEAVEVLSRSVATTPTPPAYEQLGIYQYTLGDLPAAERSLRAALDLDSTRVRAHETLGLILSMKADKAGAGKTDLLREAVTHFDRAVAIKPDQALSLVFKGQVQTALGDQAGGLATLERAVEVRPDLADAHLALLLFLEKAGRLDDARRRLPDAERVIPADDEGFQALKARLAKRKN